MTRSSQEGSATQDFRNPRSTDSLVSAFLQDEITVVEDRLQLILGAKFEHSDFTGFEVQPSIPALFTPERGGVFWASVARAVRTPSQVNEDVRLVASVVPGLGGTKHVITLLGSPDVRSGNLLAWELGWRFEVTDDAQVDVTAFLNEYDDLITIEPGVPDASGAPIIELPNVFDNLQEARAMGGELAWDWRVTDSWRLHGAYSYFTIDVDFDAASADFISTSGEKEWPAHTASLRSYFELAPGLEADATLTYVDSFEGRGVRSYVRADLNLGWRPSAALALSLGFRDLLDPEHPEYGDDLFGLASEVERAAYFTLRWTP